ncbi:flippase [Clostridium massiliodielmoense]|uniref:flippase n=1 Tax=Clostridium massiliodielmoense TaxID=1776385 RepID=UPI000A26FCA2|nr:flippase [Clostridium massiliodielmoense]
MNKIAKNLLSIASSSFISQFLAFIMIAYYARILGAELFGRISLAQTMMTYFTMITLFGFQTSGTREVSKNENNTEELASGIVITRFLVAIICFLVIIGISFGVNKGIVFRNILIVYGLTLFPLAFNLDWFYSGIQQMHHNAVYNVLKSGIPFVLIWILFKTKNDILLIPLFTFVGLLCAAFYHTIIFKKKFNFKISLRVNKKKIIRYVIASIPFLLSGLLSMINCNIDSILIGFIKGDYDLGIYSSAYKIIFFLINLIAVIFTPFFPLFISYYHDKDIKNLKKVVNNVCKIVVLIGVPIVVGGIFLSKEIILLVFGEQFIESRMPFIILLLYILVLFMRETYGYGLNAWNREGKYLKSVIISSIVNLILNLIFIPRYGIVAASITTLVSELLNFFIMRKYALEVVSTNYLKNIAKIIIPILFMSISILTLKYFNINVIVNIIFAIIVYFALVICTKYIEVSELRGLIKK